MGSADWKITPHTRREWPLRSPASRLTAGRDIGRWGWDQSVSIWDVRSGALLRTHEWARGYVYGLAFDAAGGALMSGSGDKTVRLWDVRSGLTLWTLDGHLDEVNSVAFEPQSGTIATGSDDMTVKIWEFRGGRLLRTLEGHTDCVAAVVFSSDGQILASRSEDHTVRLWRSGTWETLAVIRAPAAKVGFQRSRFILRCRCWRRRAAQKTLRSTTRADVHVWELDFDLLLGRPSSETARAIHHTTGKIVLVGDHSVGKSALGFRMIHDRFEKQESTHGQQFWVFSALGNSARMEPIAKRFSGTSRGSQTIGWCTRFSSMTPISHSCYSTPRTCGTHSMVSGSG